VVDHIRPHRGDPDLFWDQRNWQRLHRTCHSSRKQAVEKRGAA
jgi:5-methylcytosine-specific restriction endonuclease McrA